MWVINSWGMTDILCNWYPSKKKEMYNTYPYTPSVVSTLVPYTYPLSLYVLDQLSFTSCQIRNLHLTFAWAWPIVPWCFLVSMNDTIAYYMAEWNPIVYACYTFYLFIQWWASRQFQTIFRCTVLMSIAITTVSWRWFFVCTWKEYTLSI